MEQLYVGIMSGTSLDGIDIALTSFSPSAQRATLMGALCMPFPTALRNDLLSLCQPGADEIHRAGIAGQQWATLAAQGVNRLLQQQGIANSQISAIGSHGQTIRHHPESSFSVQIGAPALLAELCGIDVICDFRNRDLAAGGEGAPLVPAFHAWLLTSAQHTRALVNIGGFANMTLLGEGRVSGFDSGPGNVLLDYWAQRHMGQLFDADGAWARSGQVVPRLLENMLQDPYFSRGAPKSTGREYFHPAWLEQRLSRRQDKPVDVQATLLELTARTIVDALASCQPPAEEVYICGGGVRNGWLMERLQQLLAPRSIHSTAVLDVDPDWMEAIAFAWLAWRCTSRQSGNLPAVTGARGERILGAIYPA
ncbi:anhydro-N-acetylmuramic acid kinase [Halopseudomonas litoralis]|uniref:Anhydro-N-acetylmuramic acid kinase n=1 Tax=Halopseudomonas litoralis TaxID=797277 RepID=A0A1H1Y475_9GAMM|nr:anhydro-N-acetylmuramic acid kinase [Halopseudomonas litoralis]SDT16192.1 anhydro-N-acetylmuramic acid kinase [Halopseudomonas litoralis]